MVRRLALLVAVVVLAVATLPMLAANKRSSEVSVKPGEWPQWRGPHRNDVSDEKGLLKKWPEGGPKLAWEAKGIGAGFSSISIAGGSIYTMGDQPDGQYVMALELEGGKTLWKTRVGDTWDPNGYSGPRCTPAIDGERVFVLGSHGDLVCCSTADGKEQWRKSLPRDFGGKMHSGWGFSESPLVDGDRLICTPGGPEAGLVALKKETGETVWKSVVPKLGDSGGDGAAYASIVVGNGAGVRQYVQFMGRGVVGVEADNGKFLWGYNRVANGTANIPTPLVQGDYVFCSSGYGTGAALLKLTKDGDGVKADEQYWLEPKDFQNHHGGMVIVGDYLYCGHGHNAGAPTCLEWKTGKIVWRHDRGPGSGTAGVTYADGNMVFRFENGIVALIGATPKEYEEHGKFELPQHNKPSWPHPVVAGGKLYLREQDSLFCYDVKK